MKVYSTIPASSAWDKPLDETKGKLRRQLKRDFPLETYHQRSKIETIITPLPRAGNTGSRETNATSN